MRTHAHRPPRRALPLLLLAALLALGGGASRAGLAPRPAAAVTPGKNGRIAAVHGGIVTMTAKGKQVRQLTDGTRDFYPRWSPDGRTLLFRSNGDLWAVPAASGDPVNLTNSAFNGGGAPGPRMARASPTSATAKSGR